MAKRRRRSIVSDNPHVAEMQKAFEHHRYYQDVGKSFEECLEIWAIELLATTGMCSDELLARYKKIVESLSGIERSEIEQLSIMLTQAVVFELERGGPRDILGELYEGLDITNGHIGQYFTPNNVCELMSQMAFTGDVAAQVEKTGYISVYDPAVGSGRMLLAFTKCVEADGSIDYHKHVYMEAIDIDIRCVWMTFIQLSMYGIPARVFHGNALSSAPKTVWRTPDYIFGRWEEKIYPPESGSES